MRVHRERVARPSSSPAATEPSPPCSQLSALPAPAPARSPASVSPPPRAFVRLNPPPASISPPSPTSRVVRVQQRARRAVKALERVGGPAERAREERAPAPALGTRWASSTTTACAGTSTAQKDSTGSSNVTGASAPSQDKMLTLLSSSPSSLSRRSPCLGAEDGLLQLPHARHGPSLSSLSIAPSASHP